MEMHIPEPEAPPINPVQRNVKRQTQSYVKRNEIFTEIKDDLKAYYAKKLRLTIKNLK